MQKVAQEKSGLGIFFLKKKQSLVWGSFFKIQSLIFNIQMLKIALVVSALLACAVAQDLGDGLWRTFSSAIGGNAPALPLTVEDAENDGSEQLMSFWNIL